MSEESVFAAARAIPDPAARTAYLDRACAGDPALRREVEDLLAALVGSSPLDRPIDLNLTAGFEPAPDAGPARAAGDRIDKYKLMEPVGEGGMGEVWVADQLEPIRRRVALKLVKPGMDSRTVLGRFEAERQALALMDHPNIARVLDAGTTADGRPFFVMELVKGVPITQFCDARKLSARERLGLFVPVCQAIQHAHQKGVIHRDIKPSNVLVELHDDRPVPKVIDFGVAKAVGQQLTEKTVYTGLGALVGTPAYMAPEQATFNALDVDTRADVYALGVLLYELLAGSPPFEPERLKRAAFDEVLRMVREEDPPRPSARLSTSEARASIAAVRRSDPAKLSRLMRGELDWIVMKALEKDRSRRYDSAAGFGQDVQRFLGGEPVQAVPPSAAYRVRKFVRRHRAMVLAGSAIAAVLVAAAAVSVGFGIRAKRAEAVAVAAEGQARRERDEKEATLAAEQRTKRRARSVLKALMTGMFGSVISLDDLDLHLDRQEGERLATARMLARSFADFANDPRTTAEGRAVRAEGLLWQGVAHLTDGKDRPAAVAFGQAEELFAGLAAELPGVPEFRNDRATCLQLMAMAHEIGGRPAEADAAIGQAEGLLADLVATYPDEPDYRHDLAGALEYRATIRWRRHDFPEQVACLQRALGLLDAVAADRPAVVPVRLEAAAVALNLGEEARWNGRPGEGARWYAAARQYLTGLAGVPAAGPEVKLQTRLALRGEAQTLASADRHAEAAAAWRQVRDLVGDELTDFEWSWLARELARAGDTAASRQEADAIASHKPRDELILFNLGVVFAVSYAGRAAEADRAIWATRAVGFFRAASEVYSTPNDFDLPELTPLRADGGFQRFLAEVEARARTERGPPPREVKP